MKPVLVGVGQAGGKVTQALLEAAPPAGRDAIEDAVAINTAKTDLQSLPMSTVLVGQDRVGGHGVGGDNELAAEIFRDGREELLGALDGRIVSTAESIIVVAGLGGGTGSGGAPALVHELQHVYDLPIYVLGILPAKEEGALYQANAGRSLKTVAREADATILVSNDAWRESGESVTAGFDRINRKIAQRIGLLLGAGERAHGTAEQVVDTSEIINTLQAGQLSAVGYADAVAADGPAENINTITAATRSAIHTGTSLPGASDAESALLIVAGNPDVLSRKGVERARSWLEEELGSMQVRGGDLPIDSDRIAAITLLGGVERSDRIETLFDRARDAAQAAEAPDEDPAEALQSDDLDGVF